MRQPEPALRLKRALQSEDLPFDKLRFVLNRAPKFTDLSGKSRIKRLAESLGRSAAIPLSQEQLADMCVLSRGAVSRILSRLEGAGKVRRGYREIWWLEE